MILQVKQLTKIIDQQIILNNISFDVNSNQIISIIGHSGAGKSTLLSCLNGLTKASSGEIIFPDLTITHDTSLSKLSLEKLHQNITLVFQSLNLFPHLNVIDNLTMALTLKKKKGNMRMMLINGFNY